MAAKRTTRCALFNMDRREEAALNSLMHTAVGAGVIVGGNIVGWICKLGRANPLAVVFALNVGALPWAAWRLKRSYDPV